MLFKGDAYITIETKAGTLDFSQIDFTLSRRLALDFKVDLTDKSDPNESEVTIYNLTASHRSEIAEEALKINVYAGYDVLKLIGTGDVIHVENEKSETDWKTKIVFGDGHKAITQSKYSRTYRKGTLKRRIISDLIASMALVTTDLSVLTGSTQGAVTLDGLSKDLLSDKCKDWGISWSIQQDEVILVKTKDAVIAPPRLVIQASTGLLETPSVTKTGVKIKSQLNPDLQPNVAFKLVPLVGARVGRVKQEKEPKEPHTASEGTYVCERVTFSGNNYGGAFDMQIEARGQ